MPLSLSAPRSVLALVLVLAPTLTAAQPAGKDPDELFAKAVTLHQAGDTLGALQYYQAVLELQPRRVEALSNLGAAYMKLGRLDEAIAHYKKALAVRPDMASVRLNLGLAFYKADRTDEAAPEFAAVLQATPKHPAATLLLADCRLRAGESQQVIDLLSPLEAELGDDRLFAYLLGTALLERNEVERGQRVIDRLFRAGDSAEGHVLLAVQYLGQGQALKAVPEMEKALALNPELPGVHALYARALRQNHDNAAAAVEYRKELERNPNDFESNLWLGILRTEANQLDEALEYLKRAGRLRPRDPSVAYGLGRVHLSAERFDEARTALEQLVEVSPDYSQGHVLLATAYYRLGLREKGDAQRAIVEKLRAEAKASAAPAGAEPDPQPGAAAPAHVPAPAAAEPAKAAPVTPAEPPAAPSR
jgi:tetratricopeptide (TPR) repeat protein